MFNNETLSLVINVIEVLIKVFKEETQRMKCAHRFLLTQLILLFSSSFVCASNSFATENNLGFVINAPGTPPFIYFDEKQSRYQGVVVDFFDSFDRYNVEYIDSSRARNEQLVITKKADLFVGSSIWMDEPDRFIYSESIMPHNSFLYAVKKFENPFFLQDHKRAFICTRHAFSYPNLQPYFDNKTLVRIDSSSQTTMTLMLAKGRCDYAIMSEENALALMFDKEFCEYEFYQSPDPITIVNIGFIIGRHLTEESVNINQQISDFINSGERDKSLQKHIGPNKFPKRVCEK